MQYTVQSLPKGVLEFSITVAPEEITPALERAAQELSEIKPLPGFRPGKAPLDIIKSTYGEMAIYEQALSEIVRKAFAEALEKEKVNVYGQPEINVKTLAPGNPIVFTAEVVRIPKALTLAEPSEVSVEKKAVEVLETDVKGALNELSRMQTHDEKVERAAEANDKIVVDMDLSIGGVAVDGGQARNHGIYLGEEYYIPGVKEKLIGLKAGEEVKFTLPFPADHFQKHLAGKDVDFAVTAKEVYALHSPKIDDEFAKTLGQTDLATLSSLLSENIKKEKEGRENERQEIEMLEGLVKKSTFEDVPDALINGEVDRMVHELQHDVESQGLEFSKYLESIQKDMPTLKLEFAQKALQRVHVALLLNGYAEKFDVVVSDEELLSEVTRLLSQHVDPKSQERIRSEAYQDYLRGTMRNRRVITKLREMIVK